MNDRLARERTTVRLMIDLQCRGKHRADDLCAECTELITYVEQRLANCPFQAQKPTCLLCQVHCYAPAQRARIKQVMRYAGPRMLLYHPVLTAWHWLDGVTGPAKIRQ